MSFESCQLIPRKKNTNVHFEVVDDMKGPRLKEHYYYYYYYYYAVVKINQLSTQNKINVHMQIDVL